MLALGHLPRQGDEFQRAHRLDQADVEQPVVDHRVRSNQAAAADQARVADGEGVEPLGHAKVAWLERDGGHDGIELEQRLRSADQVGEPAGDRLQLRRHGYRYLADQAPARGVDENAAVHLAEIDTDFAPFEQHPERRVCLGRNAERGGKVIAGSERDDPDRHVRKRPRSGKAVHRLVDGSVAAGDEQRVASLCGGRHRGPFGIAVTIGHRRRHVVEASPQRRVQRFEVLRPALAP